MVKLNSIMRRFIFLIFFLLLIFTPKVFAHGGFEKNAENTIVYINQLPVSPLVGEKVNFTFQFRDPTVSESKDLSTQNLANIPVEVSVIDTFYGDESKDKRIFNKKFETDENGNISFDYIFPKENYYDIEFSYEDHRGKPQETGFLVQPRDVKKEIASIYSIIPLLISGSLIGFLISLKLGR